MALLTADELLASREAREAGIDDTETEAAEEAIAEATSTFNLALGFKIDDPATTVTMRGSGLRTVNLPNRARAITALTSDGDAVETTYFRVTGDGWVLTSEFSFARDSVLVATGTFGFDDEDDEFILAKKAVKLLAIRYLQTTSTDSNLPTAPAGAYLTNMSSQDVSFSFFTPSGDLTGYEDTDRIVRQLQGARPNKASENVVRMVPIVGSSGRA